MVSRFVPDCGDLIWLDFDPVGDLQAGPMTINYAMRDGDKPLNTELSPVVTICSPFLRGHDDGVIDCIVDYIAVSFSAFDKSLGRGAVSQCL
ncbi:hypothetical protein [Photorhabdus laumondii]